MDLSLDLDPGEVEAIALAEELHADRLLIDNKKGRAAALRRQIPVAGTLTVLAPAAERRLIDLPVVLDQLAQTNFRAPARLLREIRERYG